MIYKIVYCLTLKLASQMLMLLKIERKVNKDQLY